MAYFLQVKSPRGGYKSLNISESPKFSPDDIYARKTKIAPETFEIKTSGKKIKYSLCAIDKFTMQFQDECELKLHLIEHKILPADLFDNPLVIRFSSKRDEVKNYRVFFLEDYFYFEPDKLINLINNRYLNRDFRFLLELAKYVLASKEVKCFPVADELYRYTNDSIQSGTVCNGFSETDPNGDNVVIRLTKLLMHKFDVKSNMGERVPNYHEEFNWRTLHLLIEFIKNYEQNEVKEQSNIKGHSPKKFVKRNTQTNDEEN